jgi:hypothetical protein
VGCYFHAHHHAKESATLQVILSPTTKPSYLSTHHKAVILSEAPRRSAAYTEGLLRGVEGPRRCLLVDAVRSFLMKSYKENQKTHSLRPE